MKKEIEKRKKIAIEACREIGSILLHNFGRELKIESKGQKDLVTDIDKKCEEAIIRLVNKYYPADGILSEERPASPSGSGWTWIIDPIDGTHNFIHGIDIFGTSCAVAWEKEVILGIIYMPGADEFYTAQKGEGAFCNGKKIGVSRRKLADATLIYDSSIHYNSKKMLGGLEKLAPQVFNIRMFGSTVRSLAYVASGKAEAEVEFNDKVWDFAAGLLLVEEAGGQATDFAGRPWNIDAPNYIASNGIVHKEILETIGTLLKGRENEEK
ncbi:MAG: inositol monophosphatase [Candidatus Omnitrophota bacterium]